MYDDSLVSCKFDVVFKFLLVRNQLLVKTIIEGVTKNTPSNLKYLNPQILPSKFDGKLIIFDTLVQDELGNYYDIEMQYSSFADSLLPRFHFYSADMLTHQLPSGGDYALLKPTYQIIFIEDTEEGQGLVKEVKPTDRNGIEEAMTHQHTYYVFMPYINVIAKEKGLQNLSLFEKIVYGIENNLGDDILELGGEVLNCMNNDLQEFITEEENIAYLRAYKGSRMIIDGYQRQVNEAIADRDKAINLSNKAIAEKNEAIADKKKTISLVINLLVNELNFSVEDAMKKLNVTKETLS